MTRLLDALRTLGLEGEVALAGRWVKLRGERRTVYVAEAAWGSGYYTWCDDPEERAIELYRNPTEAIEAGLRRARKAEQGGDDVQRHVAGTG
jgi:hypothetical protein